MSLAYYWSKFLKKLRGSAIINSEIHITSKIESGSNIVNTTMNKHSFCGYNCEIANAEIGSFCSIANGVVIGGGIHPYSWVSMSPAFYEGRDSIKKKYSKHSRQQIKKTIIGHDVWIGQNALIKQGVNIGTGAVIGMGAIVTRDVEPYTIVGGNPAKVIKTRFNEEIINSLLESKWWTFEEEILKDYAKHFKNPIEFLKNLKQ
jgi:acetyltransferase-like isoleucine patch superfamily enzyme